MLALQIMYSACTSDVVQCLNFNALLLIFGVTDVLDIRNVLICGAIISIFTFTL